MISSYYITAALSSRHTETSMKTATLIHHTLTQRMPSTSAMSSMQPSSISVLQLKSTPFTHSNQKPLSSISHKSPDTPAPPTLAIVSQGNGEFYGCTSMRVAVTLCPTVV